MLTVEQRADVSTSFLWRHLWQPIHTPHKTFFILPTNPLGKIFPVIAHPSSAGSEQISVASDDGTALRISYWSRCTTFRVYGFVCQVQIKGLGVHPFNPFLIHHLILPPSVRWIYEGLRVSDWTLPVAPQPAADARDSDDREAVTSYHSLVLAVFLCRLILSLFKFSLYISWMVIPLNKRSFCSHFLGFSTHNPCSKVSDTCHNWNWEAIRTRPALVRIDNMS